MPDFDRERCKTRNRIAARRDGVEALPWRVFTAAPAVAADTAPDLRYAHGTLLTDPQTALAAINAGLPEGAPPLTAGDVYVHYLEAANGNLMRDRYGFWGASTLRNAAKEAAAGVAFMNSHRDGGLSHPADLPMGRTFTGRYEDYRDGTYRTLIGFYMLAGVAPNGASGPTTDDLHRMIVGGTTFDVSIGAYEGATICDVCANPVDDWEACPHDPGTLHNMTAEEVIAQAARGVPAGRATYTIEDAHLGEVSAVFDGAVPGAGFRKTLALARRRELSRADLLAASAAYGPLLRKGDLPMDQIGDMIEEATGNALSRFFKGRQRAARQAAPEPEDFADDLAELQPQTLLSAPGALTSAERTAFAQEQAAFAAEKAAFARRQHLATAEADVERLIRAGQVDPRENLPNGEGHPELTAVFAAVLGADAALYGRLMACYNARAARPVGKDAIPVVALPTGGAPPAPGMVEQSVEHAKAYAASANGSGPK